MDTIESGNNTLRLFLKKKGTGQTMGKHLLQEELAKLSPLFKNPDLNRITQATLLTALLSLPKTEDEAQFLDTLISTPDALCDPLPRLLPTAHDLTHDEAMVHALIQGQDLAGSAFSLFLSKILDQTVPDFLGASFLEAARLKEESLEENLASFDRLWDAIPHRACDGPLLELANPYDGFNRTPNLSLFIAMLLGKMGYPTLITGVETVAPKQGVTVHQVLKKAGLSPIQSVDDALLALQDSNTGWAYLDQSVFHPKLYALNTLRFHMVKRPVLATVEKFMSPVLSKTHALVTGYTHPPYRQKSVDLLQYRGYTHFLIVRGQEGSAQLSMDRRAPFVLRQDNNTVKEGFFKPSDFGLRLRDKADLMGYESLEKTLELGMAALDGKRGLIQDTIAYNAAVYAATFGKERIPALLHQALSLMS